MTFNYNLQLLYETIIIYFIYGCKAVRIIAAVYLSEHGVTMTSKKSTASNSKVSISKKIQNLGNVENNSPIEILLERIYLHECTVKFSNLKNFLRIVKNYIKINNLNGSAHPVDKQK